MSGCPKCSSPEMDQLIRGKATCAKCKYEYYIEVPQAAKTLRMILEVGIVEARNHGERGAVGAYKEILRKMDELGL